MNETKLQNLVKSFEADVTDCFDRLKSKVFEPIANLKELLRKYTLLDERKEYVRKINGCDIPLLYDRIDLNVGGKRMQYPREVFLRNPDSILAGIFSGRWDKTFPKDSKGHFFLDENPACFQYMLDNLAGIPCAPRPTFELALLDSIYIRYNLNINETPVSNQRPVRPKKRGFDKAFSPYCSSFQGIATELVEIHDLQQKLGYDLSLQFEKDTVNFERELKFMENLIVEHNNIIELNVGGDYVATSDITLQVIPDSMLATKFNYKKWTLQSRDLDSKGHTLIDGVDPEFFQYVLDYLRWLKIGENEEDFPMRQITCDQEETYKTSISYWFPGNLSLLSKFAKNAIVTSNLLILEQQILLLQWCLESSPQANFSTLTLLYRASRDGWDESKFRHRCYGNKYTVIVIFSQSGGVFGGFSDHCWGGSQQFLYSDGAFLFSLVPPSQFAPRPPARLHVRHGKESSAIFKGFTICFGASDLKIKGRKGITELGSTYYLPASGSGKTYLAGSKHFDVLEIECFAIH